MGYVVGRGFCQAGSEMYGFLSLLTEAEGGFLSWQRLKKSVFESVILRGSSLLVDPPMAPNLPDFGRNLVVFRRAQRANLTGANE